MTDFVVIRLDCGPVEAFIVPDENSAIELIRGIEINWVNSIIADMTLDNDPEVSRYIDLKDKVRTASYTRMTGMMEEDEILEITYLEVSSLPDLKNVCIHAKVNPCKACCRNVECNEHRMPDVGMMQD